MLKDLYPCYGLVPADLVTKGHPSVGLEQFDFMTLMLILWIRE